MVRCAALMVGLALALGSFGCTALSETVAHHVAGKRSSVTPAPDEQSSDDAPLTWPQQRKAIRELLSEHLVNFYYDWTADGSFISLLGTYRRSQRAWAAKVDVSVPGREPTVTIKNRDGREWMQFTDWPGRSGDCWHEVPHGAPPVGLLSLWGSTPDQVALLNGLLEGHGQVMSDSGDEGDTMWLSLRYVAPLLTDRIFERLRLRSADARELVPVRVEFDYGRLYSARIRGRDILDYAHRPTPWVARLLRASTLEVRWDNDSFPAVPLKRPAPRTVVPAGRSTRGCPESRQ